MVAVCGALALAGCGGGDSSSGSAEASTAQTKAASTETTTSRPQAAVTTVQGPEPEVSVPKGPPPKRLVVNDLKAGSGEGAKNGDVLTIQYVAVRYVNGERFESSWEGKRKPFGLELGAGDVSPGWERGLQGMRVGGRRELTVPTQLTSRFGVPPGTGPEATLLYVIDLLDNR